MTPPARARIYGYFEASRSDDALALIRHYAHAYTLAAVLAHRARWRNDGFNPHGLEIGEACLGDYEFYGMTAREYRTAKKVLSDGGFVTFKATNKGTIGKLTDTRLFKINPANGDERNDERNDRQATSETTTNLKLRSVKQETSKAYSTKATTKASKLSVRQKELADRIESALGTEWTNDAGKWIGRIKADPNKCQRVIAEVESGVKESRIKTTPAAFAEDTWKRFASHTKAR